MRLCRHLYHGTPMPPRFYTAAIALLLLGTVTWILPPVDAKITVYNSTQPSAPTALDAVFDMNSYQFFGWPELRFDTFSGPLLRGKFMTDFEDHCRLDVSFDTIPPLPALQPLKPSNSSSNNSASTAGYAGGYTQGMRTSIIIWDRPKFCIGYAFIAQQLSGLKQTLQAANLPPPGIAIFRAWPVVDKANSQEFGGPFGPSYGDPTELMKVAAVANQRELRYQEQLHHQQLTGNTTEIDQSGYPMDLDWHYVLALDERLDALSSNYSEPLMIKVEHDFGFWNIKYATDDHIAISWVINGINIVMVIAMLVHVWITYGKYGFSKTANKRQEQLQQHQQQQQQFAMSTMMTGGGSGSSGGGKRTPGVDNSYAGNTGSSTAAAAMSAAAMSPRQHPYHMQSDQQNNLHSVSYQPYAISPLQSHTVPATATVTQSFATATNPFPLPPLPEEGIVHRNFYRVAMVIMSIFFAIGLIPLPITHVYFETWKISFGYFIAFVGYSSQIFLTMALVHMMNSIYPRPILSRIATWLLWTHCVFSFISLFIIPFARMLETHYPIRYSRAVGFYLPIVFLVLSYGMSVYLSVSFYRNLRRLRVTEHHLRDIHKVTIVSYSAMLWVIIIAVFLAFLRSYQLTYKLYRALNITLQVACDLTVASIFASIYAADVARGFNGGQLEYWPTDAPPLRDAEALDDAEKQHIVEHQIRQEQLQQELKLQRQHQFELKKIERNNSNGGQGHVRQSSSNYTGDLTAIGGDGNGSNNTNNKRRGNHDDCAAHEDLGWEIGMVPLEEHGKEMRDPLFSQNHLPQQTSSSSQFQQNQQQQHQRPWQNALQPLQRSASIGRNGSGANAGGGHHQWQSPVVTAATATTSYSSFGNSVPQSPMSPPVPAATPDTLRETDWVKVHLNNQY
ncbi:hypothetical protein GQ42DRAFT_59922 [Ramicandelaber brevisporus]|nr:hypothetical protein GQ42DRAFT_59922 [Ramicandelaber brevisporus]